MGTIQTVKDNANKTQIVSVDAYMKSNRDLIAKALPAHITAERLIAMFTIVINNNPALAQCSQQSLIGALVQTAQLGLIPGNVSHCYYVPFNNKKKINGVEQTVREVQFILGYKGMVELVNRSKSACILSTEVVYENDEFSYSLGLNPTLHHNPTSGERGAVKGVYCVAKNMMANEKLFVYLTKEDIEKVRKASKAGDSEFSPWKNWYEEMAKKTVIKRICKLLPLAIDIQKKISADETVKTQIAPDMTEVKDETNWEEAAIIEEGKQQPEQAIQEAKPESKAISFKELEALKVGDIADVYGTLKSFSMKEVGPKKSKLTSFELQEGGIIKKFGECHFQAGDKLIFYKTKVEEYNGARGYICEGVDPNV